MNSIPAASKSIPRCLSWLKVRILALGYLTQNSRAFAAQPSRERRHLAGGGSDHAATRRQDAGAPRVGLACPRAATLGRGEDTAPYQGTVVETMNQQPVTGHWSLVIGDWRSQRSATLFIKSPMTSYQSVFNPRRFRERADTSKNSDVSWDHELFKSPILNPQSSILNPRLEIDDWSLRIED